MVRNRPRRPGRLTRRVTASAVVLAVLPAAPAFADGSATPHLDSIEQTLRQVSPGLEGTVWERTDGNKLDASDGDPAGWLLQTPECWGDASCADRPGTKRLLAKMTENISKAKRTVDISTLAPFPDGAFQDAIAAGLKASVEAGNKPKVRVMVGAAPVYHLNVLPSSYRDDLKKRLGKAADSITLNVASMTTSKTGFSWNHSKLLVTDGESVIAGGINGWKGDYIDTPSPVSDVDLALSGPGAASAGRYLDTLWTWTCQNKSNVASVWFAGSNGDCMPTMEKDANPAAPRPAGNVPVIAVGGLGVGIKDKDASSAFSPDLPTASDTKCVVGVHDSTNADRDYDTVNPEESALRALVSSASSHVEISQQDLNATCPPIARYDIRLYDAIAAKMAAGVKVRIVVSDPANRGTVGSGGYSQIKSLSEISDTLRNRLALVTGSQDKAKAAMCSTLQLGTFRSSDSATWADGKPYRLHHKLVSVDGSAFYVGSKNLYPSWLQDYGYIVENQDAANQLQAKLLDPEWTYAKATATFDYERNVCQG